MVEVEPVPDRPAAVAETDAGRLLLVADVHAGIEAGLRAEQGIDVDSRAGERRERLLGLVDDHDPDRLVVLGDLMHSIGGPGGAERGEVEVLLESLPDLPVTLLKGNHDGGVEGWIADRVTVTDTAGTEIGGLGLCHGHTWPSEAVLSAEVVCVGHEHPCVRLEDDVGGRQIERVWLRGPMAAEPFEERGLAVGSADPELIVVPAFNDLSGGTWVNVNENFLAPFLPAALPAGDAYLLDGTRLGDYRRV